MEIKVPIVRGKEKRWVFLESFAVYDSSDPKDPELMKMNAFMEGHPEYIKSHWQIKGSWGIDVLRPETENEANARIQREKALLTAIYK